MSDQSAIGQILLNGTELALDDVRARPMDYKDLFEAARTSARPAPGYAVCLCNDNHPKLKISRVFVSSDDRTVVGYTLRRWPSTSIETADIDKARQQEANKHKRGCFYHSTTPREETTPDGKADTSLPAIEELEEGKRNIHADFQIDQLVNPAPPGADSGPNAKGGGSGARRRRTALQTLLFTIWESAGMHIWKTSWKRDWWTVRHCTEDYLSRTLVNGQADRIFISPPFPGNKKSDYDHAYAAFWNPLMERGRKAQLAASNSDNPTERWPLAIVIGQIKDWKTGSIRLKHLKFAIEASQDEMNATKKRFPRSFKSDAIADNVIGAFIVRPMPATDGANEQDRLQFVDAALSRSTSKFILVDSSYEAQVGEWMIENDREFKKPLLGYDEEYRPDFLLLDVGAKPLIMEVYGVTGDQDYDDRKNEKRALYKLAGQQVWEWDLTQSAQMPALPEKRGLSKDR